MVVQFMVQFMQHAATGVIDSSHPLHPWGHTAMRGVTSGGTQKDVEVAIQERRLAREQREQTRRLVCSLMRPRAGTVY